MQRYQSFLLLLLLSAGMQVRSQVTNNGNILLDTGSILILRSINLVNNGLFTQTAGTVRFTGADTSSIGGTAAIQFYNLEIAGPSGRQVRLLNNIQVANQLLFTNGLLNLNGNNIILGSGAALSGESDTGRIIGANGGYVEISAALNAPASSNPGNLGAVISSPKDLGLVTIRRGHMPQMVKAGGSLGIHRYFDINPANNTALAATLRFRYLTAELDTSNRNFLGFWKSSDLQTWTSAGFTTRNSADNYVELTGITDFSRWTLAFTDVTTGIFNVPGTGANSLKLWPNPAHYTVNVSVQSTQPVKATLLVYNSMGMLALSIPLELATGANVFSFDAAHLAAGIYKVKLLGKEGSIAIATLEKL